MLIDRLGRNFPVPAIKRRLRTAPNWFGLYTTFSGPGGPRRADHLAY